MHCCFKIHLCDESKNNLINFNCTQEEIYYNCKAENLVIYESDKNLNFLMENTTKPPKAITFEASKMFFIPPEIFHKFNFTREFIARNVSLQEIYVETFADARNLRYLILPFNRLKILVENSFANLNELQTLKLQHNHIETLFPRTFYGLNELRSLVLSFNKVKNLPLFVFNDLKNLEDLEIDNNLIAVVSGEQFMMNLNIMQLNFQNNEISTIDNDTFKSLKALERVNLLNNFCVDKNFVPWKIDNETIAYELSCCLKKIEETEKCLNQKATKKIGESTVHIPLILILFISIFINILVISLYVLHKKRAHGVLDDDFELTGELNGSAYQVC